MDFVTDFQLTNKTGLNFFSYVQGGIVHNFSSRSKEINRGENSSVMKNGLI